MGDSSDDDMPLAARLAPGAPLLQHLLAKKHTNLQFGHPEVSTQVLCLTRLRPVPPIAKCCRYWKKSSAQITRWKEMANWL